MFVLDWLGQKLLTADCADSQFLLNLSPSGPGPCLGLFPSVHLARVQIKIVPVWRKLNLLDAKLCNIELSFIMLLDFYINERMFWEIHTIHTYILLWWWILQTLYFSCFIKSDPSWFHSLAFGEFQFRVYSLHCLWPQIEYQLGYVLAS